MTWNNEDEFIGEIPEIGDDEEFCVWGTVYAKPEHADELERIYTETTRLAQLEPGTIYYCLGRDPTHRSLFHFFERYAGKKAFDAHNSQPIIKRMLADQLFNGVKAKFAKAIPPAATK